MALNRLMLTASAFLLTFGLSANAANIVFSNLPINVDLCCDGYTLAGADSLAATAQTTVAMAFTPGSDATVTHIDVAIGWISGTDSVTVTLDADNGSGAPGTAIDSWTVTPPAWEASALITLTGSDALTGGDQYWLVATTPSDTWDVWTDNTLGERGATVLDGTPGTQLFQGGFDVLSGTGDTAAPEPSTVALGAGALLMLACSRRRHAASRL
jgi:hypothetical protein